MIFQKQQSGDRAVSPQIRQRKQSANSLKLHLAMLGEQLFAANDNSLVRVAA
jgi:hypothetical protein